MSKKMSPAQMENARKNLQQAGMPSNSPGRTPGSSYRTFAQELFKDMLNKDVNFDNKKVKFSEAFTLQVMDSVKTGGWAAKLFFERMFSDNILEDIDNVLNKSKREDEDFLSYRVYKMGHEYQQRALMSNNIRIYNMAGRRAGKTEANILKAVQTFITKDEAKVLIMGLTFATTVDLYFNPILKYLDLLGFIPDTKSRAEGIISWNGKEIHLKGNSTVDEREKVRGSKWDLVIIDEAQSQKALVYLLDSIVEPTLLDRRGQLMLTGTGPRIRGTHWEHLWTNDNKALKLNWNISDNPFIPDYENVLRNVRETKGLLETSPLYIREYLGQISYDDDALVYRLDEGNFYEKDEFSKWLATQPVTDVHFSAGLDYGFSDSDAFAIICYSESDKSTKWLVWEYRNNRTGITELVDAIKEGLKYIDEEPLYKHLTNKHCNIYADTGGAGKKISFELAVQHQLPVLDAYKANKDFAIETLQEEVRKRTFKVKRDGIFQDEALKTIFKRNDNDELTRQVDDEAYHPDLLDAVLYALRPVWDYNN